MMEPVESSNTLDTSFYLDADSFFRRNSPTGLTFDDVSLSTLYSEVLPRDTRMETRISDSLELHLPIISADMDTVTESSMAIGMAMAGGMGLIHYNMSEKEQLKEVARVKNHVHGLIQEPISVSPDVCIGDVLEMIRSKGYNFHTFPVEDKTGVFQGLLLGRVVKERYRSTKVRDAMITPDEVFWVNEKDMGDDPIAAADRFFDEHMGIHKLLVLDSRMHMKGMFTLTDIERIKDEASSERKPVRDSNFRLICGAAISGSRKPDGELDRDRILAHAHDLVREGIDAIAVSTAHGFSKGVGDVVRLLRGEFGKDLTIIAGNVTSGEGVEYLADCGANAIKVGQGPGSICTTRIVAGVGIPQLTALYVASRSAARKGVRIMADGGITKSGDIVKALTLADAVICGGLLAGCRESPGRVMEINGKLYKQYRGMGSLEAMKAGSAARYGHDASDKRFRKAAAEGIEALKEVSGTLDDVLRQLAGGIQSGMGYLGASSVQELKQKARYIRVSAAGLREAAPHDVIEVKTSTSEE
ncbi:MAG: IMP dehydrogenase [Opitutales bacterium]